MADATVTPAPRRRRWLRIVGWILGVLVVLVVVAYFVGTSSAFFKGVILPKVSKAMNAEVTVSDASISPFSQVTLKNLKVQSAGQEPLLTAAEVRLRYSLMDIIRGNIHVDEVTLSTPMVTLVTNPDGSRNVDPILQAQKPSPAEKKPAAPGKPIQIDIKKIALTDATIRNVKNYKGGTRDVAEISHLTVTLDDLKNGQTAKLAVGADISVENNPPAPGASGVLQAKLNGNFTLALTADLKPASIQGNGSLQVARAEGALAEVAGLAGNLNCDVTPTEIKEVALRFQKANTALGQVRVSGPFDMAKTEGRITIEVLNIDKNVLNLAGTASGIDFGPTTINSTNEITLAKGGSMITAGGQFNLNQFQLTRTNQTTPPLDLHADYNVSVDQAASNAVLSAFNLKARQKGNSIMHGELSSPMTFNWGNAAGAVGDSALNVVVTHFDLADWEPFLGDVAPAGMLNAQLKLLSQQGGKLLTFDLNSEVDNLTAGSGSNQITQATVTLVMNGKATDMKQFNLPEYKLQVSRQNQPLVTVSGSATYDQTTANADVQLNAEVILARLLQALGRTDVNISSGTAGFKAHIAQKQKSQSITGSFTLADLSGQFGNSAFHSFGTTADLDIGMTPQQVQIHKIAGKLTDGSAVGGSFALSGNYDLSNKSAQLTANLSNFNQDGLRPFLESMLGDKKLVSIAINANASVQYDPQSASSVKGDLQVTNLVVKDPGGEFPATPLETRMQADVALDKQVTTVRQFQLTLTPTSRAANQLQLTGQVDASKTNAISGNLKLVADSLDFTSYYDLFASKKAAPAKAAPETAARGRQTPPASTPPAPEKEPDAMQLPLRNFIAEASIGRLYLHDIAITNFQNTTRIDGGHIVLNPFKLALNGAPVSSVVDLDLGVPGWKYDVSFTAQAVPLAPFVDSFQPERKGIISGTLTAQAKVTGAGTTGASLQKNLASQYDFASTNLNLSIDNIQGTSIGTRVLKTLLSTIAVIPELAKNPAGTATSLIQGLVGSGTSSSSSGGGLSAELKKSPIDSIILRGDVGSGQVNLRQAVVESPAFVADANGGTITLAQVLTNSTLQIPVSISLERSVAQRINMAGNTPANATYARLPDFLTMKGTLGAPKSDVDKMALAKAVLQGVGGKAGQAGSVIEGLGLFGRKTSAETTATSAGTNQPASKAEGVLRGVEGFLGGPSSRSNNAPATNQSPAKSLLNRFLK